VDLTPYDVEDAVGVAFRLTRRRMRLSQRELAALLGWDASMVGRWETGRVSRALGRVDGILRAMGFRLVVVALDAREWADVEAPVEHLADRGFRHLPAHLDQLALPSNRRPIHWFLRHRDKPNPMAPDWTYEMRPRDRATWQRLSESRRDSQAEAPEATEAPDAAPDRMVVPLPHREHRGTTTETSG
jgi:transcriptional regulator with XRE-family HTH domain